MSRVLFTHSYFYKLDSKQWKFKQPYPPLGSLLAAAVIRAAGFDVNFFDVALRDSPIEIETELKKYKPDYLVIYDDGFNYLTKMCLTVMREAAFTMAAIAKANGMTVIVCGSDSSDQYEKYLSNGVDYVVRGEGEETLRELLLNLDKKENCKEIKGIAFHSSNETVATPTRSVIRELNTLPLPAWDLIDIEPYRKIWKSHHGYFSLNLATTRGCPFKCNWCAKPIYGNRYNSRSPERVVNEIEFLLKRFQPDHFWMCDDIFGLKPGWVKRFAELVKERELKFKYKIQSRVDLLLEENTIEALAQSGIETVWVGAESGSQKILDAMDKGTTVKQIKAATQLLHEHKIKVAFFLQFGYSGETKQDIDATLKMVLDLMPDEIGISVSYPLPGTKFYENVKSQLKEKQNWSDSDDLAMMYSATFSPAFYKLLHRYVHSRYRIKRGWQQLKKNNFKIRALASMVYHAPISVVQGWRLNQLQHAAS
ncbi:MAG TPA: radical SAM protein [Cyclobacteriaceae bacterium]|jgi:anaerobic magnesium-protoporphyrin IX monomethyl ester cyclase|nr:radical SAM protein [Cyclobacteriaceae bacterium]